MRGVSLRAVAALLIVLGLAGPAFAQHTLTRWPDNRAGAVSLTFDDGLPSQLRLAVPLLNSYGLKGTFFLVTDAVASAGQWDDWRAVAAAGHEIGSHTRTHPHLPALSSSQLDTELRESKAAIDAQITSQRCITFAYPFGETEDRVRTAVEKYYLAGRTTKYGLNRESYRFYDLDAWGDDSPRSTVNAWIARTNKAASDGSWLVLYMHTMDGTEYGAWNVDLLERYLDTLVTKNVWVGTVGATVKFVRERDSAELSLLSATSSRIVLALRDTLDNSTYDQPLTIRSELPDDWETVNVLQDDRSVQVRPVSENGETVAYYQAIPDRGPITLSRAASPPTLAGGAETVR